MQPVTPQLLEVRPLKNFRLWVRYSDGAEGEVDFSDLAGRGVFSSWDAPRSFEAVRVGPQGELQWSEEIELCADSVYMRLTGKAPEELFPALKRAAVDA